MRENWPLVWLYLTSCLFSSSIARSSAPKREIFLAAPRSARFRCFLQFVVAIALLFSGSWAAAADAVWYLPPAASSVGQTGWLPQPLRKLSGTIESFQQGKLQIVVADASSVEGLARRELDDDRIVWIQVDWSGEGAEVQQAFEDFNNRQFAACLKPMGEYVKRAKPRWRQLIAYGYLMNAAAAVDKHSAALAIAAGFHAAAPPACFYSLLPIAWTRPPINAARDQAAVAGLQHADPAVRVIAASWLLTGTNRQRADAVLARASNDPTDPLLARLADAIRWRTAAGPEVAASLATWERKVDQLPIAVQAGPMTAIADRLQASGRGEEALAWWLSVAELGKQPGELADEAAAKARQLMETMAKQAAADQSNK